MKLLACTNCGSKEFSIEGGYQVCIYCKSKYAMQKDDLPIKDTVINLDDDVSRLLQKCKAEPKNASKYALLILEIDPFNAEAKKYL